MKPTAYDEYINASKGKVQKGKDKSAGGKGATRNWRQPCSDYWWPDGCMPLVTGLMDTCVP